MSIVLLVMLLRTGCNNENVTDGDKWDVHHITEYDGNMESIQNDMNAEEWRWQGRRRTEDTINNRWINQTVVIADDNEEEDDHDAKRINEEDEGCETSWNGRDSSRRRD
jgi:hypothetical protein